MTRVATTRSTEQEPNARPADTVVYTDGAYEQAKEGGVQKAGFGVVIIHGGDGGDDANATEVMRGWGQVQTDSASPAFPRGGRAHEQHGRTYVCPNSEVASQSHYWAVNIWCENTRNHSFNALYIVFLLYSCRIDAGEQWGCAPLTTVLPKTCLTMPDLGVAS